jgi:hypothetical protein
MPHLNVSAAELREMDFYDLDFHMRVLRRYFEMNTPKA